MRHIFLARLVRHDEITGKRVTLELIRSEDAVEVHEGDEFVSVQLAIDPFDPPPEDPFIKEGTPT